MIDPYRMVVVNIASSVILIIGLLFYKFIFPKKRINLLFLLILISILPIISIFRNGTYESGDFNLHIYRTISFYDSLLEGNLMPSWAKDLNATYGYPLFIFNYPLPYYLISLFHFLGFSFIASMKLFLMTNFIFSGVFMYFFTKHLFKNNLAAFTSAIFYQFAPYHLIDLHFKISIGEILFFTFLPLLFLFLQKLITENKVIFVIVTGFCFAILIMSHVVIALFTASLSLAYIMFQRNLKLFFLTIISCIIGGFLSLYALVIPFFLSKYTILEKISLGRVDSRTLEELLFSPWRMGLLFQGPHGEISHLIGYAHIFIVVLFIILILAKKVAKRYRSQVLFWIFFFIIFVILITPMADFFWEIIPFIGLAGNHRLLLLVVFCGSILSSYLAVLYPNKQKLLLILILFTILSTELNWGQRRIIPTISDSMLQTNVWKSTSEGEGHFYANSQFRDPKNPWFSKLPKTHLEIIKGIAKIREIKRTSTKHLYIISATTPLLLRENTLFFPGWQITSNNVTIPVNHDHEGVITFLLPKGLQYVEVAYEDLFIYKILKLISISVFVILLLALIILSKRIAKDSTK